MNTRSPHLELLYKQAIETEKSYPDQNYNVGYRVGLETALKCLGYNSFDFSMIQTVSMDDLKNFVLSDKKG